MLSTIWSCLGWILIAIGILACALIGLWLVIMVWYGFTSADERYEKADQLIKERLDSFTMEPTDEEILLACIELDKAGWVFAQTDSNPRTLFIAAALTTYLSGSELANYCNFKYREAS